jgi:hypothetical protein
MTTKTKKAAKSRAADDGFDGVYLLKLVLFIIVGSLWVKIGDGGTFNIPLPIGFIIGLVFASHEHFRIDRKIDYGVLVVAMLFGLFAPYGLYIAVQ